MSLTHPIILLTRPQPQAERFADICRAALGTRATLILSPLLQIVPQELPALDGAPDALILTSENAVRCLPDALRGTGRRAYCVGDRTATAARAAGLTAISARGNADDLVARLLQEEAPGRLAHIRGAHTRGNIAARLRQNGLQVEEMVAYRQDPQPLNAAARAALDGDRAVILPLFSPRTATQFVSQAANSHAPLHVVAISDAVAEAGHSLPGHAVVADRPNAAAMLEAMKGLIDA